jgi:phage terminase large subunit
MVETKLSNETKLNLRNNPLYYGERVLGSRYWSKQEEIMMAVQNNAFVSVGSGHNLSKTHTAADIALWFLGTRPDSMVITTAYRWSQVKHQIWKEIRSRYATSKFSMLYPNSNCHTVELRMDGDIGNWIAFGLATKDKDENAFQGFKARKYVLIIIDEAPGISYEQWDGAMTMIGSLGMEGVEMKVFAIGNRLDPICPFEDTFVNPKWKSIVLSCYDSPNVTGEMQIPGLATLDWIEDKKDLWGEDSPIYKIRVLGLCPRKGLNSIIGLDRLESIQIKNNATVIPVPPFYAGLDIADQGEDKTVFVILDRAGQHVATFKWDEKTTETERRVKHFHEKYKFHKIAGDALGVGVGVMEHLEEDDTIGDRIISFKGSETANNSDMYYNKRTEAWCIFNEMLKDGDITALRNIGYTFSDLAGLRKELDMKGRLKAETKENYKKRIKRSPDYGDATVLASVALNYGKVSGEDMEMVEHRKEDIVTVSMDEFAEDMEVFR